MDIVGILTAVVIFFGGGLLVNALFNELLEWQPRFRNWCLRIIVRRLPEAEQATRMEEWAAHLNDCPGTFSKLLLLLSFWWAGHSIAREAETNKTTGVEQQPKSAPAIEVHRFYDIDFIGPENADGSELSQVLERLRNKLAQLDVARVWIDTADALDKATKVQRAQEERVRELFEDVRSAVLKKGKQDDPPE